MRSLEIAAVLLLAAVAPAAALEPAGFMSGPEIDALVRGQEFAGEFEDGTPWREAYRADGTSDYESRGERWAGDWHVSGEMFCTFYRGVTSGGCWYVRQVSDNCYHFFIAGFGVDEPTLNRSAEDREKWYARGYRKNAGSTCPSAGVS
ncbi:MAG: hypothetical protein U1E49_04170 [Hyphomicrobiaceae bacterium]